MMYAQQERRKSAWNPAPVHKPATPAGKCVWVGVRYSGPKDKYPAHTATHCLNSYNKDQFEQAIGVCPTNSSTFRVGLQTDVRMQNKMNWKD